MSAITINGSALKMHYRQDLLNSFEDMLPKIQALYSVHIRTDVILMCSLTESVKTETESKQRTFRFIMSAGKFKQRYFQF